MVQGLRGVCFPRGASSDSQHLPGSLEHLQLQFWNVASMDTRHAQGAPAHILPKHPYTQ